MTTGFNGEVIRSSDEV